MGLFEVLGDAAPGLSRGFSRGARFSRREEEEDRLEREFEARMAEIERETLRREQDQQLRDQQSGVVRGVTEGSAELGETRVRSRGPAPSAEEIAPGLERELFGGEGLGMAGEAEGAAELGGRGIGLADRGPRGDVLTDEPEVQGELERAFTEGMGTDLPDQEPVEPGGEAFAFIDPQRREQAFLDSPEGQQAVQQARREEAEAEQTQELAQRLAETYPDRALEISLAESRDDLLSIARDARESTMPEEPSITETRFNRGVERDRIEATIENMIVQGAGPEEVVQRLQADPSVMSAAEIRSHARNVMRQEEEREAEGMGGTDDFDERRKAWLDAGIQPPRSELQQDALDLLADGVQARDILQANEGHLSADELEDLRMYLRPALARQGGSL